MHDKPTLTTLLKSTSNILGPQRIMAFIGNPGSGKTVLATLLKDVICTHFVEQHPDKFEFNLIKGSNILK